MASSATDVHDCLRRVAIGLLTPFDDDLAIGYQ